MYLIIDDVGSPFIQELKQFNVFIVEYDKVIDNHFNEVYKKEKNRFTIVEGLNDRKLLFMRSFERFFLLRNLMKLYNLEKCFFLELDNLIYNEPQKMLKHFSQTKMNVIYNNAHSLSTGLCYVSQSYILEPILESYINYIIKTTDACLSEMKANYEYHKKTNNLHLLPCYWKDDSVNELAYMNIHENENDLFDAASLGVYFFGNDPIHGKIVLHTKNRWSDIDYTKEKLYWKTDTDNLKKPYIYSTKTNKEYLINNLHIHSKIFNQALSK